MNWTTDDIKKLKGEGKIKSFSSIEEYREVLNSKGGRSKYGNEKTVVDGNRFDSKKEARVYGELKLRERAGEISELELQKKYPLEVNGQLICNYIADFVYQVNGVVVVVDVKSAITRKNPVYRIKVKLMKAIYGIQIVEL